MKHGLHLFVVSSPGPIAANTHRKHLYSTFHVPGSVLSTLQATGGTEFMYLLRALNHIFLCQHSTCTNHLSIFTPGWGGGWGFQNACQGNSRGYWQHQGVISLQSEPVEFKRQDRARQVNPLFISFVNGYEVQLLFATLPKSPIHPIKGLVERTPAGQCVTSS